MRAVKLEADQKRSLIQSAGGAPNDVMVFVIDQGQALAYRLPRSRAKNDFLRWFKAALEGLAAEGSHSMSASLSANEAALLDDVDFAEGRPDEPGALERSLIEYEILIRESLTLEKAAKELGVSTSRLRQRLSPKERSLYGIKVGRGWRIPRFQFQKRGKLVHNIEHVLPHIRPDAHPLAVRTWFVTPHVDLVAEDDDKPVAPKEWLAAGRPVNEVAHLAAEI